MHTEDDLIGLQNSKGIQCTIGITQLDNCTSLKKTLSNSAVFTIMIYSTEVPTTTPSGMSIPENSTKVTYEIDNWTLANATNYIELT